MIIPRGEFYVLEERYRISDNKFICDFCGWSKKGKYWSLKIIENKIFRSYKGCLNCMEEA